MIKKLSFLFSPFLMGVLFIFFAAAMAAATFIENDFGSGSAYAVIYNSWWFELLFLLLAVNLTGQIIIFRLYRKEKLTVMLFHLAFILMIIGAAITRYTGWEGSIHIREGEEQNLIYPEQQELGYTIRDAGGSLLASHSEKFALTSASADIYRKNVRTGDDSWEFVLARVFPNAERSVTEEPGGEPMISLLVTKDGERSGTIILEKGETESVEGVSIAFESADSADIEISLREGIFFMEAGSEVSAVTMMEKQALTYPAGEAVPFRDRTLYSAAGIEIVAVSLTRSGVIKPVAVDPASRSTGENALLFHLAGNGATGTLTLWDNSNDMQVSDSLIINGKSVKFSYGSPSVKLPFSLTLTDFILDRYPGSNSPSGYRSKVMLNDVEGGVEMPFEIFMNNILKYRGYRFYQSSYDPDEKGTILSVNHDQAGMLVTYTGYALLFFFILLSLLNRKSVFHTIRATTWSSVLRKGAVLALFLVLVPGTGDILAQDVIPGKEAADRFGHVLIQDQKGRTKPLAAMSSDILRKVTGRNSFEGMTPMQVFMGIAIDFNSWKDVPLIKVSNRDLQRSLGLTGNYAAFSDIVDMGSGGSYKLAGEVSRVYSLPPSERNKTDKEIVKVDERVNIVYMIYTESFLRMIPLRDGSHDWSTPREALRASSGSADSVYLAELMPRLASALNDNHEAAVRQIARSLSEYQEKYSDYELPSAARVGAEVMYYKMMIFERLFPFYSTTGILLLALLIAMVLKGRKVLPAVTAVLKWLLFAGYLLHTFGLALRWYISGHSPMSNGYESMIFISWVTLTAGFIFSRKSAFALSATAVLSGLTLLVAHLSFMDPEITNLVPVLQSYWLTLHVSVITGSYGFLGLGAVLGIISMILIAFSNSDNIGRISGTIDDLIVINYRTLTLGLYFLTVGTFLGAVWANESWGRYWGWDPKETWSLITIIVYSFVIHSRLIPGLKDVYTFNLLATVSFASVLMTYFGVNYYLSGMHSYAGGDPVPVPSFVYMAVTALAVVAVAAYIRYKRWDAQNPDGRRA